MAALTDCPHLPSYYVANFGRLPVLLPAYWQAILGLVKKNRPNFRDGLQKEF